MKNTTANTKIIEIKDFLMEPEDTAIQEPEVENNIYIKYSLNKFFIDAAKRLPTEIHCKSTLTGDALTGFSVSNAIFVPKQTNTRASVDVEGKDYLPIIGNKVPFCVDIHTHPTSLSNTPSTTDITNYAELAKQTSGLVVGIIFSDAGAFCVIYSHYGLIRHKISVTVQKEIISSTEEYNELMEAFCDKVYIEALPVPTYPNHYLGDQQDYWRNRAEEIEKEDKKLKLSKKDKKRYKYLTQGAGAKQW